MTARTRPQTPSPAETGARSDCRPTLLLLSCLPLLAGLLSDGVVQRASTLQVMTALLGTVLSALIILRGDAVYLPTGWVSRLRAVVTSMLLTTAIVATTVIVGRELAAFLTGSGPDPAATPAVLAATLTTLATLTGFAVLVVRGLRPRWLGVIAVTYVAVVGLTVHVTPTIIDVLMFQREAASALTQGSNPYDMTFPNPYPARETGVFYGPGVAIDGRLDFGFPYPPVSLLLVLPGYLLGDVRLSMVAAVAVTVMLLWHAAPDRIGRLCAVIVAALPGTVYVLTSGWTEPLALALLTAVVVGARRDWPATPYLLGVLLVTKQYLILVLPAVWLLHKAARRSRGGLAGFAVRVVAAGVTVTVPLAVWKPSAFLDSVVRLQFRQPFREDSISLLAWLVNVTGWPSPSVYGWLPLTAGLLTASLAAWRAPRTPAAFAAAVGVTLVVTFMLSRQAFTNYYFLSVGALLVAVVNWPPDVEPDLSVPDPTVAAWTSARAGTPPSRRRWTSWARR